MSHTSEKDEDDRAPGEVESEDYKATEGRRGGGRGEFLWFLTRGRRRDQIFPVADIRRMEPPDDPDKEIAYIHLSGVSVALTCTNLRRVLHRITLNRCSALYEFRPGQRRPPAGEPVIETMQFLDMTRATRKEPKPEATHEAIAPHPAS